MNTVTMTSDEARREWREMLDQAYMGNQEVVIERWSKPVVTVVNYDTWRNTTDELARLRRLLEAKRQFAEMDAGNVVEFDIAQAPA